MNNKKRYIVTVISGYFDEEIYMKESPQFEVNAQNIEDCINQLDNQFFFSELIDIQGDNRINQDGTVSFFGEETITVSIQLEEALRIEQSKQVILHIESLLNTATEGQEKALLYVLDIEKNLLNWMKEQAFLKIIKQLTVGFRLKVRFIDGLKRLNETAVVTYTDFKSNRIGLKFDDGLSFYIDPSSLFDSSKIELIY